MTDHPTDRPTDRPTDPPFAALCIDHVVLRTADVAGLVAFYQGVLGFPLERANEALGLTQLRAGAALIDIVDVAGEIGRKGGAAPGAEAHNMDHFCLRIDPFDMAAIRDYLERHGVRVGEAGTRYGADGSGPSLYLYDPDGNMVELKGPPEMPPQMRA